MKILKDIIYGVDLDSIKGDTNLMIKSIEFDSRKVVEGSLFVAIKGLKLMAINLLIMQLKMEPLL